MINLEARFNVWYNFTDCIGIISLLICLLVAILTFVEHKKHPGFEFLYSGKCLKSIYPVHQLEHYVAQAPVLLIPMIKPILVL